MQKISLNKSDLYISTLVALLCVIFSFAHLGLFESMEKIIYGVEMRLALPQGTGASKIAIVNIDEKSLKQIGPWPWPRQVIAEMISILKSNGAKAVGLDLLFKEKESNQGLSEIRWLYQNILDKQDEAYSKDPWLLNTLVGIEKRLDNDNILLQSIKASGNIILPVDGRFGSFDTKLILPSDSSLSKSAIETTGIPFDVKGLVPATELITPYKELSENSHGFGHINLSPFQGMSGRSHLLFFNYRGYLIPSMPLSLSLEYFDKRLEPSIFQGNRIEIGKKPIIPSGGGEVLIKFKGAQRSFPYYSFVDILRVKNVPAVFSEKIVLIGYTAEGGDTVSTPVDLEMPRVEYLANVIEAIFEGRYLKRPEVMIYIEALIILVLGLFSAAAVQRMGFTMKSAATAALIFFFIFVGVLSFVVLGVWMKVVYICLFLIILYTVLMGRDIVISQRSLGVVSKETIETNRMLGLSFQSQGLLDLAFEKFRKCPMDDSMKDVIYNLGLDYERKRMINKAVAVYEYIIQYDSKFRDLHERIPKLKEVLGSLPLLQAKGKKGESIMLTDNLEIKPTVGRYEVIKELGQGAMGIVYKARDPKINRLLAIKTIRFSDEFEEDKIKDVKQRFFKEAEIAGKLSHPSIVAVYDVGEDYDLTYLAMEFLEGNDLREYCQKDSLLPLRKILRIISETALALDYAHKNEVVHRDIKPANIMLLKNGKIKVTDFGIAKAVSSSQTKSGVILGTPNYMSPEQINGDPIDGRSDMFSLGVVFFELLTGQLPFQGKNLTSLLYNVTQARHPSVRSINGKIPKACEQIIDRMLAKDPEKRFQSGEELAKYLNAMIKRIEQFLAQSQK
ncbi:MAG: CHASE2 domain-containing protein [Deltaproteobacteria bacterium]|nr:CHASE2 domain-containing protein [Deltaproteobacteria bacterium]